MNRENQQMRDKDDGVHWQQQVITWNCQEFGQL